tara:strand:+ start:7852 stop:8283 length:432 start_codon:yes stop_codon:yes gene_type:complete
MSNKRLETKYIVVHSSQTTPEENLNAKDIDTIHRKKGFLSCGYHFIILRDGTVEEGRGLEISGLHVEAKEDISNANSIGICLIGGKSLTGEPDCNFTLAQFKALNGLLNDVQSIYNKALVIGHRDMADTPCPNFEISELGKFV